MENDKASLPDETNKPYKLVVEDEKLEVGETQGELPCESFEKLGESNPSAGGESNETVPLEDKPVDMIDGEERTLDKHAVVGGLENIVEPGGGEAAAGEEGDAELIAAPTEEPPVLFKAEEEIKPYDNYVVINDMGDVPAEMVDPQVHTKESKLSVDSQLKTKSEEDTQGNVILADPQIQMKSDEQNSPVVGSQPQIQSEEEISAAVVGSNLEVNGSDRSDESPFPELLTIANFEKESATVVCSKVEVDVTDGSNEQESTQREMKAREDAMEVLDNKYESCVDVENSAEKVLNSDEVDGGRIGLLVKKSEVGTAEEPAGAQEEKPEPMAIDETSLPEGKSNAVIITGENACALDISKLEQVHEEVDVDLKIRCEHSEDKKMAPLLSGAKMLEDEGPEKRLETSKLDQPADMPESLGCELVKEEAPPVDAKTETMLGVGVGLESTKDFVMEENLLRDPEVETESGIKEVAVKSQEEDATTQTERITGNIVDEDDKMEPDEAASDVDEPGQDIYDSPTDLKDEEVAGETQTQDTDMETEAEMASGKTPGGNRKRKKFSENTSNSKSTAKASSRKTAGDDVCFICFDGGELVLCDRRGCPKAYHPSCVDRDEAFFRSKGRWNCGWHICTNCQKNARYMCYTCPFSLCKSCTKDKVILCVRGNKGFCETCMKTVMLIENNEQGNNKAEIDFDDRSSWEFLFKDYYTELKAKFSLTSVEIIEAKNPWKGANTPAPNKQQLHEAHTDANDGRSGSDNSVENAEPIRPKRRKIRKQPKSLIRGEELVSPPVADVDKAIVLSGNSGWASRELLEFVSHMKNGDTSVLSQFDVQALLLEYIKGNKLRDPRRKSQIICDARLENLFGKPRVGHFEMLKLLESHFLIRDEQNDSIQGSVVETENNQLDIDGNAGPLTKGVKDKKRKSRKKSGNREPQSNVDDYAAIDMHNIGLIYLRRKLMEDLLEDAETFHDKVVGTFVRIRISGSAQKQDMYRLVQVVGTSKRKDPYKIGKKITDIVLEILNLDKTELISIDAFSNQDFSEEECKRLRQSIRCGLISRLTVGEILDKSMELHAARVNDWLESETMRLSHLRDRASDLGRRKELRECVEKLQLLKTPKERQRRLEEIPEIHSDPKMDPTYESDDADSETEDSRQDAVLRPRSSSFDRKDKSVRDSWIGASKTSSKTLEQSKTLSGSSHSINARHINETVNENSWNLGREKATTKEFFNSEKLSSATNTKSTERTMPTTVRPESFSGVASEASIASSSAGAGEPAVKVNESEKMWHYNDPSGKVQGPFSMVQLRKWNNTGYFPADLKIWRMTETQDNSILLADALVGKFPKTPPDVANMISAINTLQSSHTLTELAVKTSGISLPQEDRSVANHKSGVHSNLSAETWRRNEIASLPSPTPEQNSAGLSGAEGDLRRTMQAPSPSVNGGLSSAIVSNIAAIIQTAAAIIPKPNSQQGGLVGISGALNTQSNTKVEPHAIEMPGDLQPIQHVSVQNLQANTQDSTSTAQGQPQDYNLNAPNNQNSAGNFSNSVTPPVGLQPDAWRPTQGNQPNMIPPATPNGPWGSMGMGPMDGSNFVGVRPENPNVSWGPIQAIPNMGWGNMNMNWGVAMQGPPPGNPTGWVAPAGNTVTSNMQGMVPGNTATQGWNSLPAQLFMPGNGWCLPGGNAGSPLLPVAQGPPQGWVAPTPPGNQGGSWHADQNNRGGQGQDQGQTQDPAEFGNGGRPWNRGGGSRHFNKRDTLCPYNTNGRCRKGSRCDYLHT
ncbi:zinc finger CCCH domain-containing protein 19-like [Andrographis paniculata]|uniref:zinc finger CCCH domain-containing protein 19-like n=1 Tax=Andrographis paniculata TaxID=175694 RepID=UPI0021E85779|nr:zinc finger CCCH domain-containing protein 19-like [Andrographis paniculata]